MNTLQHDQTPFTVPFEATFNEPLCQTVAGKISRPLTTLTGFRDLFGMYQSLLPCDDKKQFITKALTRLRVRKSVGQIDLGRIPADGPVVATANHPFGLLEGLVFADTALERRNDIKILAGSALSGFDSIRDLFIFIDPYRRAETIRSNAAGMRQAIHWVREGGMLLVFPSGAISRFEFQERSVVDPPWQAGIARIIQKTRASVLPIYFAGHNSTTYQICSRVHSSARLALLPRELKRQRGQTISMRVGNPLPYRKLPQSATDSELVEHFRFRTYLLRHNEGHSAHPREPAPVSRNYASITPRTRQSDIVNEINNLPQHTRMVETSEYRVFCAEAALIPTVLNEIGRLRETTFRSVGEGTGRSCDIDAYDSYYLHNFLWNHKTKEVVGAYRIGQTDRILNNYGVEGLYTYRLFEFDANLMHELDPALELGRSFVRVEYQRQFAPLLLLWKGIGAFVARHPQYSRLYGAVSISNAYSHASRELMKTVLTMHHADTSLAGLLRARHKLPAYRISAREQDALQKWGGDIETLSSWIADLETDIQGVPVLIRQYLKLGGQFLGFNVDPNFSNTLDGFIVVDLREAPERHLARLLGKEAASAMAPQSRHDV